MDRNHLLRQIHQQDRIHHMVLSMYHHDLDGEFPLPGIRFNQFRLHGVSGVERAPRLLDQLLRLLKFPIT